MKLKTPMANKIYDAVEQAAKTFPLVPRCGRCAELEAELAEHDASFDLRWKSDMRAISDWQEAHPGNDLVWPGRSDLCMWLMEQLAESREKSEINKRNALYVCQLREFDLDRIEELMEQLADTRRDAARQAPAERK